VILHCNYEEIQALKSGARSALDASAGSPCATLVIPESKIEIEVLLKRLEGDLLFDRLADVARTHDAVESVVDCLRAEMDAAVVADHPAHEGAVAAYFDYAHALVVLARLREMRHEMEAVIELVTGTAPSEDIAREFVFPD
jgi:hypothetical protein